MNKDYKKIKKIADRLLNEIRMVQESPEKLSPTPIVQNLIEKFEADEAVSLEKIHPYLKELYDYYIENYSRFGEPVLVIDVISNGYQKGYITLSNEFSESVENYIDNEYPDLDEEGREYTFERINFDSKMLKKMLDF